MNQEFVLPDMEEFPFGGKLLMRLVCPQANTVIGEVRTNPIEGPLLWYRVNILHGSLMRKDDAPTPTLPAKGDQVELRIEFVVDRVELRDGEKVVHVVPTPRGSKKQRGGRVAALNEYRSVIRLDDAGAIVDWGLGCPACGTHQPDLVELRQLADEASRSAHPLKFTL
jgi:hypothetical protein